MSGSGKSEQEHVPHLLHKKWKPGSFLDISRCSHANQRQGNVQESVLQLDLLLFFTVLVKGIQLLIFHISLTGLGYFSMPRKKFDSGKIGVLILNVYAACPEPDTSPYFCFSQEYGFVSTNIGTMTQLISHSGVKWNPKIFGSKNVMKEGIWKIISFVIR